MFIKKEYGLNKKIGKYCSGSHSILQHWKSSGPTPPLKIRKLPPREVK